MWVFCCGMRRAGSTLQYQLTKEIVESKKVGSGLGWVEPHQFTQLYSSCRNEEGFFVVKSHRYIEKATELFSKEEAKAIYVYRDIRDVVVSMMNQSNKSFARVMLSRFVDLILDEHYKWTSVGDILVSKYETMVTDLGRESLRIADYLGVDLDESAANLVAEKYTSGRQVQRIRSFNYGNLVTRSVAAAYDPASLLHANHIHSGKSEQWRTTLSRFQVGLIENIAYDWLIDRGYPTSQDWTIRKVAAIMYLFSRIAVAPYLIGRRVRKLILH